MKTLNLAIVLGMLAVVLPAAHAQKGTMQPPKPSTPPPAPPPVWEAPPGHGRFPAAPAPPQSPTTYVYDQKPMGGRPALLTSQQAQTIIGNFKQAYPKLGSPRFLLYVNRELVDENSGLKLIRRTEQTESSREGTNGGSVRTTGENTYRSDGKAAPTLADQQTVRDVERLFGRPLRAAGASLADQKVAATLIADKPLNDLIGSSDTPQARRNREAVGKVADAVIEILISSKKVNVQSISGDQTITIPDIQATAIRLSDSKIIGQASSSDAITHVPASTLGMFDVSEIAEATALALMEDMTPENE